MKKTYTKPALDVVQFTLNETIASCAVKLFNHTYQACKEEDKYTDDAKWFVEQGVQFVEDDIACADGPLKGYCYFTAEGKMLMNS